VPLLSEDRLRRIAQASHTCIAVLQFGIAEVILAATDDFLEDVDALGDLTAVVTVVAAEIGGAVEGCIAFGEREPAGAGARFEFLEGGEGEDENDGGSRGWHFWVRPESFLKI